MTTWLIIRIRTRDPCDKGLVKIENGDEKMMRMRTRIITGTRMIMTTRKRKRTRMRTRERILKDENEDENEGESEDENQEKTGMEMRIRMRKRMRMRMTMRSEKFPLCLLNSPPADKELSLPCQTKLNNDV